MNREYNDNKMYNSALDELRFSEEAKSRMVDRLMAAAEQPEQPVAIHRVRRFPRIAAVGVAAALVLSIGAGATGVFKSASDAFAGVFGPTADTEIIDQIGRPIGASDTAGPSPRMRFCLMATTTLSPTRSKRRTVRRSTARKTRIPVC